MRKTSIVLFLFASVISRAQTKDALDSKFGFKDIKFESDIKALTAIINSKEVASDSVLSIYDITEPEYLKVGECNLSSLKLVGFRGKVYSIKLATATGTQSSCILQVLNELYGRGTQSNQFMQSFVWIGQKAVLLYDENEVTGSAEITMYGLDIRDKAGEYFKTLTKKAANDF